MSSAKKIEPVSSDQTNAKIQRKFDTVFTDNSETQKSSNEKASNLDTKTDKTMAAENKNKNANDKKNETTTPEIGLDLSSEETSPAIKAEPKKAEGPDFTLNFDLDAGPDPVPETVAASSSPSSSPSPDSGAKAVGEISLSEGFSLDDLDLGDTPIDEGTKKTVIINVENLTNSNLEEFKLEDSKENSSLDLMTTEEANANMESTIKDILKPSLEDDTETDAGAEVIPLVTNSGISIADVEDSVLDFNENTPSRGFDLNSSGFNDSSENSDSTESDNFSLNDELTKIQSAMSLEALRAETTNEFNVDEIDEVADDTFSTLSEDDADEKTVVRSLPKKGEVVHIPAVSSASSSSSIDDSPSYSYGASGSSSLNTEDSMRFQATIRALREEREELLAQVKKIKGDTKEFEQDNLTLKASLDEAKIEITILRKRHMVELEDLKYRLTMSEEKKALADERARQAEQRREKLEQKVRIDFNQVKQREKELESKLELLSMDVDSQVQSRDQKILELRRKIDALEFNMENASIKEQKSLDDKRKLEDRLNKIMKTLRHSIKNLEDDIDHTEEDDDFQKEKN